jgi:hypothetical protein
MNLVVANTVTRQGAVFNDRNCSIDTGRGILIFRDYSYRVLVPLGSKSKESLKEWRRLHRFRNVLYRPSGYAIQFIFESR